MSHTMDRVEAEKKGSNCAVVGSGISVMSDSLIAFQPPIDEPSNITPSANASSSTIDTSKVTCCHLPRGSVNRKSTYLMSLSLIALRTSLAVFINRHPLWESRETLDGTVGVGGGKKPRRWVRSRRDRSRRCGCGSPLRRETQKSCHHRC